MTKGQEILQELLLESEVTRRYLEAVPFEKMDWQPAEKSEKLGRLAVHLAEIYAWWTACIHHDKLDFENFQPKEIRNSKDLLEFFDGLLAEAKEALNSAPDQEFEKMWSMTYGDHAVFTLPKIQVARIFIMNHIVHHRAQLGVYLRILDVPLPAVYGPSADDDHVTMIQDLREIIT